MPATALVDRLAVRLTMIAAVSAALALPVTTSAAATAAPVARSGVLIAARGILPPHNPSRSLRPDPDYLASPHCAGGQDGRACNAVVLRAIAHARKVLEKMAGMTFELAAYEKLTPLEQLFVTVDIERVARGLHPAVVLTRSLDAVAQIGAREDDDPPLSKVPSRLPGGGRPSGIGGNWAGGLDNALGANYGWMYDDGLNSGNLLCTKKVRTGCWGHRDNILGRFNSAGQCGGGQNELAMGAGHISRGKAYGDSETELLVGVCGPTPTDVVITWARARALLGFKS